MQNWQNYYVSVNNFVNLIKAKVIKTIMNKIGQKIFVSVNKLNVIDLVRTPAIM